MQLQTITCNQCNQVLMLLLLAALTRKVTLVCPSCGAERVIRVPERAPIDARAQMCYNPESIAV